ncbi:unnamed protein product [Aureobasidium mustum]|uniref:Uncharacterized protein n=1 Tax=Aureobasidium mustum TaxID=2773714 RepID=A0A9N8JYG2_9PEZI|nr:unnamed protein product [Aureobasidium mustum]
MIKFSDHIAWQSVRVSETSNNICHVLVLSSKSVACFSVPILPLFLYAVLAEKNHAIGSRALQRGITWSGVTLIAFAAASVAAVDVALFIAGHYANQFKAIFNENVLRPIVLPVINQATDLYTTTRNKVAASPDTAKSYLRRLLKDETKMQQVFEIFSIISVTVFILSSLYLQLSFSGLLSQDDLHHVFRTYLVSISSLGCLMYILYLCHTALVQSYGADYLRQTAGFYWLRLTTMAGLDEPESSIPQTPNGDIFLPREEELPGSEELLILHLRSQQEFDFTNKYDLVALFRGLSDDLSIKLPELVNTESVTIMPPEYITAYDSEIVGVGGMIEFFVTKQQRTIGYFSLMFVPSKHGVVDLQAED